MRGDRNPRGSVSALSRLGAWLRLEELETRTLLSAASLAPSLVARPLLTLLPASQASALATGITNPTPPPAAYTPVQIRQAYESNFTFNGTAADGTGQTIAIVDAYDDPNIVNDLHVFDTTYGLPDPPSVSKVDQSGHDLLKNPALAPAVNSGWAGEISLDVEWAHAIAPKANIVLVEANSDLVNQSTGVPDDLMKAVDYASAHAHVVSMSWGTNEFLGESSADQQHFATPGVTYVASSGDSAAYWWQYSTGLWPSLSPRVLSVGGTTLKLNTVNGTTTIANETGWQWSGGGKSGGYPAAEPEPAFQRGFQGSGRRTAPDVAYNADPNTGVAIYDSVPDNGSSGWYQTGGTSAGAPQWAALVALADQGRQLAGKLPLDGPSQTLYAVYNMASASYSTYYHDIKSGYNGWYAGPGYDFVTGLGSPHAYQVVNYLVNKVGNYAPAGTSTTITVTKTASIPASAPTTFLKVSPAIAIVSPTSPAALPVAVPGVSALPAVAPPVISTPSVPAPAVPLSSAPPALPFTSPSPSSPATLAFPEYPTLLAAPGQEIDSRRDDGVTRPTMPRDEEPTDQPAVTPGADKAPQTMPAAPDDSGANEDPGAALWRQGTEACFAGGQWQLAMHEGLAGQALLGEDGDHALESLGALAGVGFALRGYGLVDPDDDAERTHWTE